MYPSCRNPTSVSASLVCSSIFGRHVEQLQQNCMCMSSDHTLAPLKKGKACIDHMQGKCHAHPSLLANPAGLGCKSPSPGPGYTPSRLRLKKGRVSLYSGMRHLRSVGHTTNPGHHHHQLELKTSRALLLPQHWMHIYRVLDGCRSNSHWGAAINRSTCMAAPAVAIKDPHCEALPSPGTFALLCPCIQVCQCALTPHLPTHTMDPWRRMCRCMLGMVPSCTAV